MTFTDFITKWAGTGASERANFQPFCDDLCDLIGVERPQGSKPDQTENAYVFEKSVPLHQPDGSTTTGRIDLYKRGHFVMEGKQCADEGAVKKGHGTRGSAAEEAKGRIRYLRSEYQNPEAEAIAEQTEITSKPLTTHKSPTTTQAKRPWPKTVAEQAAAVRTIIRQTGWTSEQDIKSVAQHFKGVRAPKVQAIAEALIALGQAV